MIDYYLPLKNTHFALAITSISFFTLRAVWAFSGSPHLQKTWVKITPHVIDSFLLLTAIILAILSRQYPLQHPWLTAKVFALCLYIVFGSMAIKRAKTPQTRMVFLLLALSTFTYIVSVAFTKNPLVFT